MTILFSLTWLLSLAQTIKIKYYNASIDSAYFSETSKFLTLKAAKNCPIGNFEWTGRCNYPRTLVIHYTIKVNSIGEIESIETNSAVLNCKNEKGGITTTTLGPKHLFNELESCQKQKILSLKIKPLTIKGKSVNTEINYAFRLTM